MLSECPYMLSNSPRAGRQAVDAYSCCPLNVAKSQVQVRPSPRGRGDVVAADNVQRRAHARENGRNVQKRR